MHAWKEERQESVFPAGMLVGATPLCWVAPAQRKAAPGGMTSRHTETGKHAKQVKRPRLPTWSPPTRISLQFCIKPTPLRALKAQHGSTADSGRHDIARHAWAAIRSCWLAGPADCSHRQPPPIKSRP